MNTLNMKFIRAKSFSLLNFETKKERSFLILLRINNLNMKIDGLEAKIDNHAKQLKEILATKKNKKG